MSHFTDRLAQSGVLDPEHLECMECGRPAKWLRLTERAPWFWLLCARCKERRDDA